MNCSEVVGIISIIISDVIVKVMMLSGVQLVGGQFELESNFVINDPDTVLHMLTLMDSCSTTLQASHIFHHFGCQLISF